MLEAVGAARRDGEERRGRDRRARRTGRRHVDLRRTSSTPTTASEAGGRRGQERDREFRARSRGAGQAPPLDGELPKLVKPKEVSLTVKADLRSKVHVGRQVHLRPRGARLVGGADEARPTRSSSAARRATREHRQDRHQDDRRQLLRQGGVHAHYELEVERIDTDTGSRRRPAAVSSASATRCGSSPSWGIGLSSSATSA